MIKPIEYDDAFGCDDAGRPCAVQLHGNVYAFGYEFAGAFKPLFDSGCSATNRLFTDGAAFIFVYDPRSKEVELWQGPWKEDEPNIYSIVNPARRGLLEESFDSFESLKDFAKSEMGSLGLRPGKLAVSPT